MNNMFNLTHILNSDTIPDISVKSNINETYLSSALSLLEATNADINDAMFKCYTEIAEAPTKQAENAVFGKFFNQYKDIIKQYEIKVNELYSRFSINVDTFIDANLDLIDSADLIEIIGNPTCMVRQFDKLDDPEYPKIKPYKVFKKEFKYFGKLLQDIGPSANDETRIKIIASVYNNMVAELNEDWAKKCMEKISDCDDCGRDSFAKCIFDTLVKSQPEEKPITVDMVNQAKLSLMNSSVIVSAIKTAVDMFNEDLDKVAEEFGSLLFRNKDLMLDVKTDVDGVEDRKYRLTDYSFNQVNLFMNAKLSQITEICNLYLIALSIKMDCAMKYFRQCKDIIEIATTCKDQETLPVEEEPEQDTSDDFDDYSGFDDFEDGDDFEFSNSEDEDGKEETPQQDVPPAEEPEDIEQESSILEATIFEYTRSINKLLLRESFITEADAGKTAIMDRMLSKIEELVDKFNNVVINQNQKRIDYVKNNQNTISSAAIPENTKIPTIEYSRLLNVKRQPLTYPAEKDIYANDNTYFKAKYSDFAVENQTIKDSIVSKVIGQEKQMDKKDVSDGIKYITTVFKTVADSAKADLSGLKTEKRKGQLLTNSVSESSDMLKQHDYLRYFMEADNNQQQTQGAQQQTQATQQQNNQPQQNNNNAQQNNKQVTMDAQSAVKVYYSVNTKVLAAKMSCAQKVFNIYYTRLAALSAPPTK